MITQTLQGVGVPYDQSSKPTSEGAWWPTIDKYKIPPQIIMTDFSSPDDKEWGVTEFMGAYAKGLAYVQAHHVAMYLSLLRMKKSTDPGFPGVANVTAPPNATVPMPPPTPQVGPDPSTRLTCKGGAAKLTARQLKPGATVGLGAYAPKSYWVVKVTGVKATDPAGKRVTAAPKGGGLTFEVDDILTYSPDAAPPVTVDYSRATSEVLLIPSPPAAPAPPPASGKQAKPMPLLAQVTGYANNRTLSCTMLLPVCVDAKGRPAGLGACAKLNDTSVIDNVLSYLVPPRYGLLTWRFEVR